MSCQPRELLLIRDTCNYKRMIWEPFGKRINQWTNIMCRALTFKELNHNNLHVNIPLPKVDAPNSISLRFKLKIYSWRIYKLAKNALPEFSNNKPLQSKHRSGKQQSQMRQISLKSAFMSQLIVTLQFWSDY